MKANKMLRIVILVLVLIAVAFGIYKLIGPKESSSDNDNSTKIASLKDLEGKSAGVMTGTPQRSFIEAAVDNVEFFEYSAYTDIAIALEKNKIDFFANSTVAYALMEEQFGDLFALNEVIKIFDIGTIFPMNSKGESLKKEMDEYINKIKADGTLKKLQDYWLSPGAKEDMEIPSNGTKGVLNCASCSSNKPYSYILNGQMSGFDMAVIIGFCKEYGYGLNVSDVDFAGMIAGISAGKFDLAAGQISWTEERSKSVLYSELYYRQNIVPIVRKSDVSKELLAKLEFNSLEELKQAKVLASVSGTIISDYEKKYYPDAKIKDYNSVADLAIALHTKKVDAFIWDEPIARAIANEYDDFGVIDELLINEDYYFIFDKNKTELQKEFNEWLADKKKTSYLDDSKAYWIETDLDKLKPVDFDSLANKKGMINICCASEARPGTFMLNNKVAGYTAQLVRDFAADRGYAVKLDIIDTSALVIGVASGKYDVAVGFVSKTAEREKQVLYSDSVYSGGLAVVVRKADVVEDETSFWSGLKSSFKRTLIDESRWKLIASGIGITVIITIGGFVLANILGIVYCLLAMSKRKLLRVIADIYSYIMQGTPMVVVLMVLYYIVFGNSNISGVVIAILGFGLAIGAYMGELFYGAVKGVDNGQWEAALAMGFTKFETFKGIIFPQMVRTMLSGYFSQLISLMKGTAIVGYIAVQDLTKAGDMIRSSTFEAFFPLILVAVIYLLIACIILTILKAIKKRLDFDNRKQKRIKKAEGRVAK